MQVDKVKKLMSEKGYTYTRFADEVGVSRMAIWYQLNKGAEPSLKTFKGICRALGCKAEDIW